jgi:hypothetical protein
VFNNPTRFVDPSGYQLAYSEMPVFVNFGSSNWTYYSSGGGGSFLRQWDEQHKGSIVGYNYNNGTYEYANGDIAGTDAAINQLYRGNHNYKITFDGVNDLLYEVKAFGRSTYIAVIGGTLGEIYYSSDGAIGFSGMFAGAFIVLETEEGKNQIEQAYLKYEADYVNRTRTAGSLVWYNSDGSEVARYKATSGSGSPKYFTLPARKYTASNYRITSDTKFMKHGIGFKVTLGPSSVWDADKGAYRTALLIHPARYNGTQGCIGLIGDYNQISDFQNRIKEYLQINNTINVIVEY